MADRARGLGGVGIGEPALVSFGFKFTTWGDGDLARAFREGDMDRDRWCVSRTAGDCERTLLIVVCLLTGVDIAD